MQIKDSEVARISGLSTSALSHRKKTDKQLYEIIRLGSICKKYQLNEEELQKYIELKSLICSKNSKL